MTGILAHLFVPRRSNNHRAKILHSQCLLILVSILFIGSFFFNIVKAGAPQVLGDAIDISSNALLLLTNQKRLENGDSPLRINTKLQSAAMSKAKDMFAKDYWAHNSPSGETPWVFIKNAGYDYTFAGENLARGFTSSQDVINAWMASPEHRDNMLSKNYQDVGFAIKEGSLLGEQTVLVVEMFGSEQIGSASVGQNNARQTGKTTLNHSEIITNSFFDTNLVTKGMILLILSVFIVTLFLDMIIIRRKNIVRFVGHNIDHMLFLGILIIVVLIISQTAIL